MVAALERASRACKAKARVSYLSKHRGWSYHTNLQPGSLKPMQESGKGWGTGWVTTNTPFDVNSSERSLAPGNV